jgi:Rrf2 family protein
MNDARLSSAIHLLVLVSEAETPMSSEQIAQSVGTNASYIRRIIGSLRQANIIESQRGRAGFTLIPAANELDLLTVYQAVCKTDHVQVFDLHHNPNDQCVVGAHIRPVLNTLFSGIAKAAEQELARTTLADCIAALRAEANR